MLSESLFQTLNLPLRCNNYELVAISFIVSARYSSTGQVFGTSLDPCIAFPRMDESVMLDSIAFNPLMQDEQNFVSFCENHFKLEVEPYRIHVNCNENQNSKKWLMGPFIINYIIVKINILIILNILFRINRKSIYFYQNNLDGISDPYNDKCQYFL